MKSLHQSLKSLLMLIIISIAASLAHADAQQDWDEQDTVMVGRISHVEGGLSRYAAEADQWSDTTAEAPIGIGDTFESDAGSKAEFILPNNTWIRIDEATRIHLTALDSASTELDLSSGTARLINRSSVSEMVVTSPFGAVSAPPGAIFDLILADQAVEVIALQGSVYFTHNATPERHEVHPKSSALLADTLGVTATPGYGEAAWTDWNRDMDQLWAIRLGSRGASAAYLPPELQSEAYALDAHGRWEMVPYNGSHYRFWRPVQVGIGWSPFTFGAWMAWHGDHVWVPTEPFGYVTHHYGNWIYTAGAWYWAPPVTRIMVRARLPLLTIGFGWYPGRVGWIHSGVHIGWIPLAPYEPYYTHRRWGRRCIVVSAGGRFHHPVHHYRHHRHKVVIHRNHLYRSRNYRQVRIHQGNHGTMAKSFRPAPLPNRHLGKGSHLLARRDRFKPLHKTQASRRGEITWNRANRRLFGPPGGGSGSLKFRRDTTRPESLQRHPRPARRPAATRKQERRPDRRQQVNAQKPGAGRPSPWGTRRQIGQWQSTPKVHGRSIGEQNRRPDRRHRFNVRKPAAEQPFPRVTQRRAGQWQGSPKVHGRSIGTQNRRPSGRHYRTGPRGGASAPARNRAMGHHRGQGRIR